jgi:hypothetical protein
MQESFETWESHLSNSRLRSHAAENGLFLSRTASADSVSGSVRGYGNTSADQSRISASSSYQAQEAYEHEAARSSVSCFSAVGAAVQHAGDASLRSSADHTWFEHLMKTDGAPPVRQCLDGDKDGVSMTHQRSAHSHAKSPASAAAHGHSSSSSSSSQSAYRRAERVSLTESTASWGSLSLSAASPRVIQSTRELYAISVQVVEARHLPITAGAGAVVCVSAIEGDALGSFAEHAFPPRSGMRPLHVTRACAHGGRWKERFALREAYTSAHAGHVRALTGSAVTLLVSVHGDGSLLGRAEVLVDGVGANYDGWRELTASPSRGPHLGAEICLRIKYEKCEVLNSAVLRRSDSNVVLTPVSASEQRNPVSEPCWLGLTVGELALLFVCACMCMCACHGLVCVRGYFSRCSCQGGRRCEVTWLHDLAPLVVYLQETIA